MGKCITNHDIHDATRKLEIVGERIKTDDSIVCSFKRSWKAMSSLESEMAT
jgi:hypothetical protein